MDSHHCTQLPKLIVFMFAILSIKSMNENKHAEIFRNPVKVDCLNISGIDRELIQSTKRFK